MSTVSLLSHGYIGNGDSLTGIDATSTHFFRGFQI